MQAGIHQARLAAHLAPQLRHSSAGSWHRSAHDPDFARARRSRSTPRLPASVATSPARRSNPLDASNVSAPDIMKRSRKKQAMTRPPLRWPISFACAGNRFIGKYRSWLDWHQLKVLHAIAALPHRNPRRPSRSLSPVWLSDHLLQLLPQPALSEVPDASARQVAGRPQQELLATSYFHVVFTLPHELSSLALQNKKVVLRSAVPRQRGNLLEVAADPKHLGAEIGFLSVLHTWGQNLLHHPHVHCVIPAGGLSPDHQRWVHPRYRLLLAGQGAQSCLSRQVHRRFEAAVPITASSVFAGHLKPLAERKAFSQIPATSFSQGLGGLCQARLSAGRMHVLHYLARYTHRVAISNHRLMALSNEQVTFRWKDYAHGSKQRQDDRVRRRVLAAVPSACSAPRLRPHPLLRLSGQPTQG